ncbi:MAG: hypothetical protein K0S53_2612 [Bacteroidetes bacterium]|jgi:hypothetical protein|nr:hypothetical protein [Bacteroidota bacterium]
MKSIKIILLTIIFLIVWASCKKVKLPGSKTSGLIGKWTLVSETNGWGNTTKSNGKTTIEFTKYGKCNVYQNSILKSRTKFSFVEQRSIYSGKTEYIIDYSNMKTSESFEINGNILFLNAEAYDGGGKELRRK